ncbi:uncharacterized protein OCT59_020065 [Rhizophagus irregularis]|uniref:uncharacterized protein n=1 Tax=Rhizophagus irregularis TaxID=588596 RepID=UPI00331CF020|nr:hypothetical protein OCT59_020065 [Rhizophagus irregularis]
MPREFSEDLYCHIVYLYTDGLSTVDIANTLHMSKGVVNKIKKRYNRWACVINPFKGVPGRRKLFSRRDMTILRGLVREKLQKAALERNEIVRAHYLATFGEHYTQNQLIFIDESAKDERSLSRLYGYSPRNTPVQKKVVFIRGKRYTILPALTMEEFIGIDIFEGSYDRKKFVDFVLNQVVSNNCANYKNLDYFFDNFITI